MECSIFKNNNSEMKKLGCDKNRRKKGTLEENQYQ
jgi:hypothetical protein